MFPLALKILAILISPKHIEKQAPFFPYYPQSPLFVNLKLTTRYILSKNETVSVAILHLQRYQFDKSI